MGLFGKTLYAKVHCPFIFNRNEKKKEPTLKELAEEKFSEDRKLIMYLDSFLHECRKKRQLPTRLAWSMQLQLLEKFPKEVRVEQVKSSIMKGYRAIAYEENLKKYKDVKDVVLEKEENENIITTVAY